jgi:hypothetical protein
VGKRRERRPRAEDGPAVGVKADDDDLPADELVRVRREEGEQVERVRVVEVDDERPRQAGGLGDGNNHPRASRWLFYRRTCLKGKVELEGEDGHRGDGEHGRSPSASAAFGDARGRASVGSLPQAGEVRLSPRRATKGRPHFRYDMARTSEEPP